MGTALEKYEAYAENIKNTKKYNCICDETIARIVQNETGKYKSEKETVKSIKTKLHQITAMFINGGALEKADSLIKSLNKDNKTEIISEILKAHESSNERLPFAKDMFRDIFKITGNKGVIWDIACGFNPFFTALLSDEPGFGAFDKYIATDINLKLIEIINRFFCILNINGQASANDILCEIPDITPHNVLLFKIVPLLERQNKGYFKCLVERIRSEYFTITFPTRTVSGKNVGMYGYYDKFIKSALAKERYDFCFHKEYFNESLYIVKKK